jgi:ATP-binding cassette subfamily C (CFTR/MRP) protein 4
MIINDPDARSHQHHFIYSWVLPILLKGRKKILDLEDLYKPLPDHYADTLGSKLEKAWLEQLSKQRAKNKKPSLMAAGLKVFGFDIIFLGTLLLIFEMLFKATMPIFLGGIVRYYANERSNISEAYLYSAGLIACSFFSVLSQHSLMLSNLTCGMRIRIAACSMIYRKSLKLSKTAMINTTSGQIVNLLSNDVGR